MKTIYNTYVVMESQEQCDRMKHLCIDNGLNYQKDKCDFNYLESIDEDYKDVFRFSTSFESFSIWFFDNSISFTEITEQEFIELLKTTK